MAQTLEALQRQLGDKDRSGNAWLLPSPFPSLALSDSCLPIRVQRIGAQGTSGQRGPNDDAAVGDSWAVPAGPVMSVHASVLKPDVADAGGIVGECV